MSPLVTGWDAGARRGIEGLAVAAWRVLVPLAATATVLDVGADAGTLACALAGTCGRAVVLDPSPAHVGRVRQRLLQDGLANTHAVGGRADALPVRRGSVDLALLGGALGRVGREAAPGGVRAAQVGLLRAVHDVLKPGGWVVLGVDNRFTARLETWRDASLRSVGGYRRLLVSVGYCDVRIWCALPNHEHPRFLVPCRQRPFSHFLRRLDTAPRGALRALVRGTLHRFGLLKYTAGSYCIIARSRGGGG